MRCGLGSRRLRGPCFRQHGLIVQKGLRLCSGQTHVKRYLEPLTKLIQEKKVDTTFLITHRSTDLADGPIYQTFKTKKDGCVKIGSTRRDDSSRGTIWLLARPWPSQGDSHG